MRPSTSSLLTVKQLLQNVGGAVSLKGPHFHFAEALTAEAGFAAQRLLRDEGVGARAAGVHFVVDQVMQLHHVDVAHRGFLLHGFAGAAVEQLSFAVPRQAGLFAGRC